MRVGIAADHGGFEIKTLLASSLREEGHDVLDFGPESFDPGDDYPDFIVPLAIAVAEGGAERGIAVCGSGVGASIAANKIRGARAALVHDCFSAHQGVEDDDMNVICIGGKVAGYSLARDIVRIFLEARFAGSERHLRRLAKIAVFEK
ncbi:MAG: RpiB/LacA/LacB family sugar-phosphate isomerase [Deltaproteobacteria bacterium]|nr:RpiB/LacA/LacB family sugar-phosphate isomerase [Deltaproteobacteria bacterium]